MACTPHVADSSNVLVHFLRQGNKICRTLRAQIILHSMPVRQAGAKSFDSVAPVAAQKRYGSPQFTRARLANTPPIWPISNGAWSPNSSTASEAIVVRQRAMNVGFQSTPAATFCAQVALSSPCRRASHREAAYKDLMRWIRSTPLSICMIGFASSDELRRAVTLN